jgi:hypothetical protein
MGLPLKHKSTKNYFLHSLVPHSDFVAKLKCLSDKVCCNLVQYSLGSCFTCRMGKILISIGVCL